ncbi:hypothetical protein KEM54_005397 [Ascosphaera aggregata]|nr:hypothetical protein KEM54_005397 [Ascosphaera aggregata]
MTGLDYRASRAIYYTGNTRIYKRARKMCSTATSSGALWSTRPPAGGLANTSSSLRNSSSRDYVGDENLFDDNDLFPSFDAGYLNGDQLTNFSSTPSSIHGCSSSSSSPSSSSQQKDQPLVATRKPLQIFKSGLDEHVLVTRDDTTIEDEPTHHVDYLTHPWTEEDIWSTWQYVLSKKSTLTAAARLQNASWRCWGKCKNGGLTVPAEKIDWLKDYDVLWLYGPLISYTEPRQSDRRGYNRMHCSLSTSNAPSSLSPTTSSQSTPVMSNKKSILKKRTASQIILQRSLMTQTLVKHAAGILESRCDSNSDDPEFQRPSLSRQLSDLSSTDESYSTSALSMTSSSSSTSSATTPTASGKRHIKFNNEVVQCIAVDCENLDDEVERPLPRFDRFLARGFDTCVLDDEEDQFGDTIIDDDDEMSDDNTTFNHRVREVIYPASLTNTNTTTPRSSFSSQNSNGTNITTSTNRTIAMLPPTTLKAPSDVADTEELKRRLCTASPNSTTPPSSSPQSPGVLQSFYPSWLPKLPLPGLVRSESTETIRPIAASSSPKFDGQPQFQIKRHHMLDEDDVQDDDMKGPRMGSFRWRTASRPTSPTEWPTSPSSASFSYAESSHKLHNSNSPISSDMFRPFDAFQDGEEDCLDQRYIGSNSGLYDSDNQDSANYRLVDKVLDTVNTARDIAHVIWNVGWRA